MTGEKIDGYVSFAGGMDSSRSPSILGKNQYVYSINAVIPKSSEGIANRKGFRPIKVIFETKKTKEIWESGNPQGCGYYTNNKNQEILIYIIGGYVFELKSINSFIKKATILNLGSQFDPNIKHVWVTKIPSGAIVNNGQEPPLYTDGVTSRRTKPNKRELNAGLMGAYVQNRLWYVRPNRKEIWASTIKQPLSLDEAYIDNIFGISAPEDDEQITAIGKQGTIGRDAVGGNLAFATIKNFYTSDVRGARTQWGIVGGQSAGFVDNTLPGLGAISGNSFESFNSNVFFRNPVFGLISLNQGRSEFANKDAFTKQSIEASLFFDNDTKFLLDSCYTKGYNKGVYTTIAPQQRDGFVYWNGLIVKTPDPYYGKNSESNNYIDIIESIFTGLRPWNIQTSGDVEQKFYALSYDYDCVNRLYVYDESINYDIDYKGKHIPIEWQILGRSLDFAQPLFPKIGCNQFYSLDNITKDTNINISTRSTEYGEFKQQFEITHKLSSKCARDGVISCEVCPESRENVAVADDTSKNYFTRQDLFKIRGACSLRRWIRTATIKPFDINIYKQTREPQSDPEKCASNKIYTHRISQ